MNNRPLPQQGPPVIIGLVTRERVYQRTRELAALAGRIPLHIRQADYEQAKQEVTGETDNDRQLAMLDAVPPLAPERPDLLDQLAGIAPFYTPRSKP